MDSTLMAPPLSRHEIERFADHVRHHLGLDECLYVPIIHVVEHILPQIDDTFQMIIQDERDMYGEYANYCPDENALNIRQDVYIAACNDDPRHRFTIAHELGHYFIHDDVTSFSRCSSQKSVPTYRDPEWQANVFGSAFLMPKSLIRGMTAFEVAKACKTSLQSAEIALKYIAKKS